MSEYEVRAAAGADAVGIGTVHVQAWRETYTRLLPQGELDQLEVEPRARRWADLIQGNEVHVWVATRDEQVIGWASTGAGRGRDAPRGLELEGIYVLADHQGSGVAQGLLDAAIGDAPAFLWVADDNPRATAFYRRNGFEFDGARQTHPLVRTPIDVVRMVR